MQLAVIISGAGRTDSSFPQLWSATFSMLHIKIEVSLWPRIQHSAVIDRVRGRNTLNALFKSYPVYPVTHIRATLSESMNGSEPFLESRPKLHLGYYKLHHITKKRMPQILGFKVPYPHRVQLLHLVIAEEPFCIDFTKHDSLFKMEPSFLFYFSR